MLVGIWKLTRYVFMKMIYFTLNTVFSAVPDVYEGSGVKGYWVFFLHFENIQVINVQNELSTAWMNHVVRQRNVVILWLMLFGDSYSLGRRMGTTNISFLTRIESIRIFLKKTDVWLGDNSRILDKYIFLWLCTSIFSRFKKKQKFWTPRSESKTIYLLHIDICIYVYIHMYIII